MTTPAKDRTKLPKWAQMELERLERNEEHWKRLALAGPLDSDTFLDTGYDTNTSSRTGKPLGIGRTVLFGREKDIEARWRDGELVVMLHGALSSSLAVVPQATNVVRLRGLR